MALKDQSLLKHSRNFYPKPLQTLLLHFNWHSVNRSNGIARSFFKLKQEHRRHNVKRMPKASLTVFVRLTCHSRSARVTLVQKQWAAERTCLLRARRAIFFLRNCNLDHNWQQPHYFLIFKVQFHIATSARCPKSPVRVQKLISL